MHLYNIVIFFMIYFFCFCHSGNFPIIHTGWRGGREGVHTEQIKRYLFMATKATSSTGKQLCAETAMRRSVTNARGSNNYKTHTTMYLWPLLIMLVLSIHFKLDPLIAASLTDTLIFLFTSF